MAVVEQDSVDRAPLVIAVTAHRNLVASEVPRIVGEIRQFFEQLAADYPHTPLTLLSPLAEGGGRLAARVAIEMKMNLLVPLPLPVEMYKADFEGAESVDEFDSLCQHGTIIELPLYEGNTLENIETPGLNRNYQYAQAGIFLSSYSHVLMAIWDGKPSDAMGGTAQVVDFHLTNRMAGVTQDEAQTWRLFGHDENDIVYHIACSRDQPNGAPAESLQPLQTSWLTTDKRLERDSLLPKSKHRIFVRMDEFNADIDGNVAEIARHDVDLVDAKHLDRTHDRRINRLFRTTDWLAIAFQKRVRRMFLLTYNLAIGMGLAFIIYGEYPSQKYMIWVFLSLFAIGVFIYSIAQRGQWHRKYLDYRALAEGLRVQLYWQIAGVCDGAAIEFSHSTFLREQDAELGWIRNVMRAGSIPVDFARPPPNGAEIAIRYWLEEGSTGQPGYYRRKATERERLSAITRGIGMVCLWAGIAVAVFLGIYHDDLREEVRDPLIVLMGVLPLIAAVREAYAHKKAEKELIKQYRFTERIFSNAREQLEIATSDDERKAILEALGKFALDEHAEWMLMHRERPLEYGKL